MSQHSPEATGSTSDRDSRNFVRDFLFGEDDIDVDDEGARADIIMDLRTEGWIGIPHGGIGMGAIMELATMLGSYPQSADHLYPLSADFRMGGSSVKIGDKLSIEVSEGENGARGIIYVGRDVPPYLSASIKYKETRSHNDKLSASYVPAGLSDIENRLLPLPHYNNCFVCGVGRSHPGLQRHFYFLDTKESEKTVVSTAGLDAGDRENLSLFQCNNKVHPIATFALLDETLGWAGFMASGSGAVTVRISYTLYRDIEVGERLVAFGHADKVKGNAGSRLLFWASGMLAVVNGDGSFEIAMAASGQWLGVPELTRQMKAELIPQELTARAFMVAGAR